MNGDDRDIRERVIRIDERTQAMSQRLDTFVSKEEFRPVRALVYGGVSFILLTVLGGLLAVVVQASK